MFALCGSGIFAGVSHDLSDAIVRVVWVNEGKVRVRCTAGHVRT